MYDVYGKDVKWRNQIAKNIYCVVGLSDFLKSSIFTPTLWPSTWVWRQFTRVWVLVAKFSLEYKMIYIELSFIWCIICIVKMLNEEIKLINNSFCGQIGDFLKSNIFTLNYDPQHYSMIILHSCHKMIKNVQIYVSKGKNSSTRPTCYLSTS